MLGQSLAVEGRVGFEPLRHVRLEESPEVTSEGAPRTWLHIARREVRPAEARVEDLLAEVHPVGGASQRRPRARAGPLEPRGGDRLVDARERDHVHRDARVG